MIDRTHISYFPFRCGSLGSSLPLRMTVDAPFRISSTILRCVSYLDPVTSYSTIPGSIATLNDNHMIMFSFRNTQGYVPVARKNCLTLEEFNLLLSKRLFLFCPQGIWSFNLRSDHADGTRKGEVMNYLRPANAHELFVAVQGTQSAKLLLLLLAFPIFWWLCGSCGTFSLILMKCWNLV